MSFQQLNIVPAAGALETGQQASAKPHLSVYQAELLHQ